MSDRSQRHPAGVDGRPHGEGREGMAQEAQS